MATSSHFQSRRQRCRDITANRADATEFTFPDEPLVVYFYNPFSAVILRPVLERLCRSLDASPRPTWIIYYNPVEAALFNEFPSFVPSTGKIALIHDGESIAGNHRSNNLMAQQKIPMSRQLLWNFRRNGELN
ncbi:MAG: hypothetical protein R3C99_22500 [Pirellulaceae bacterium]